MRSFFCSALGMAAVIAIWPQSGFALTPRCDHPEAIRFGKGQTSATRSGSVSRGEAACYLLRIDTNQTLGFTIVQDSEENVEANVYAPGYRLEAGPAGLPIVRGHSIGRVLYDANADTPENDFSAAPKGHTDIQTPATGTYLVDIGVARGSGGHYVVKLTGK
jgi:hypothetical protein